MKLKQALETLDIEFDLDDGDMLTDVIVIAKVSRLDGETTVLHATTTGTDGITKLGGHCRSTCHQRTMGAVQPRRGRMSNMVAPREIVTFGPPGGEFRKAEYPWLRAVRLCVRGSDGGASSDGSPGESGETRFVSLSIDEVPALLRVTLGRGGRGAPGAQDGEDGFAIIELYDQEQP